MTYVHCLFDYSFKKCFFQMQVDSFHHSNFSVSLFELRHLHLDKFLKYDLRAISTFVYLYLRVATSHKKVYRQSLVEILFLMIAFKVFFTGFIRNSHTPPIQGLAGSLKIHFVFTTHIIFLSLLGLIVLGKFSFRC